MAHGYGAGLYGTETYGAVSPLDADDLCVQLFLRNSALGQWLDVTSYVRESSVSYTRGYGPDSTALSPGSAQLLFDNRDGRFSPRYASGSYYGQIGRGTPLRISLGERPVGRGTVLTGTSNGTVLAAGPADDTVANSANIAVFATVPVCNLTTPTGMTEDNESDGTYASFSTNSVVDVDGDIPNKTATVSVNSTAHGSINVGLPGTWTYRTASVSTAGAAVGLAVDTANGNYVFVGQAWSADAKGNMSPPFAVGDSGIEWAMVADSGASTGPRSQGWWAYFPSGTYTVVIAGDLGLGDTYGCLYQSSDAPEWSPRFTGVVREWPVGWSKDGGDYYTPLQASGGLYQGRQDALPTSPLRQALIRYATHYWPMEDDGGPGFTPATAGSPRLQATVTGGTDTAPVYGADSSVVGSYPIPTFLDAGASVSFTPIEVDTQGVAVGCVLTVPSGMGAGANILVLRFQGGQVATYGIEYTNTTTLTYKITYNDGTTTATAACSSMASLPGGGIDNGKVVLVLGAADSGADIAVSAVVQDSKWNNGYDGTSITLLSGTVAGKQWGSLVGVDVGLEVGSSATKITTAAGIGHLVVGTAGKITAGMMHSAAVGFSQWGLGRRVIFGAAPVPTTLGVTLESGFELDQGPVVAGTLGERLQAIADTDQALIYDAAGFVGLNYYDRSLSESRALQWTVTYSDKQLTDPLVPADDDQGVLNRVVVQRPDGWGEAAYEATSGPLGTVLVGPYSQSVSAFPNTTGQTQDLAEWLVNLGTVDAQRWPAVTVEWSSPGNASNLKLPRLQIGEWIKLAGLPSQIGPDVQLQIVGIREEYTSKTVRTTYVTRPAEGWQVVVLDDSTFGVIYNGTVATSNRLAL